MTLATCDTPQVLFEELIDIITHGMTTERDLQTRIGPSEIGTHCDRWLLHLLAGNKPPEGKPKWKAWVGTQIHAGLEAIFRKNDLAFDPPRYLLERRVTVGIIGGQEISGNLDLFDTLAGAVIDWKTASKSMMVTREREIRLRNNVGPKYRAQLHGYGLGMALQGYKVNTVMCVFMPRDGELADALHWAEPFDAQVAMQAIEHCDALAQQITTLGFDKAYEQAASCGGTEFCPWCPYEPKQPKDLPAVNPDDPFDIGEQATTNTTQVTVWERLPTAPDDNLFGLPANTTKGTK